MQGDRGVTQCQRINTGNANVDGVSLHMQAVAGYAGRAGAKEFIAPRGAVAADDVNFGVGAAEGSGEIGENVEDAGVVMLDVAGSVVPEEMVELFFGFGKIVVAATINDVNTFACVRVIEPDMVLLRTEIVSRSGGIKRIRGQQRRE